MIMAPAAGSNWICRQCSGFLDLLPEICPDALHPQCGSGHVTSHVFWRSSRQCVYFFHCTVINPLQLLAMGDMARVWLQLSCPKEPAARSSRKRAAWQAFNPIKEIKYQMVYEAVHWLPFDVVRDVGVHTYVCSSTLVAYVRIKYVYVMLSPGEWQTKTLIDKYWARL